MPLYICAADRGAIPDGAKGQIAREVTRVHCEITGAPPTFVHCFFFEKGSPQIALLEHVFRSSSDKPYVLFGNLRAGRTEQTKDRVIHDMCRGVAAILGIDRDAIDMATQDIPAKWVMEGGDLLPEPGEEEAWLQAHNEKIAAGKHGAT
jgi:phenylpyruvate tautomerase PptA (4-oxalocrotonate tautomerase family)